MNSIPNELKVGILENLDLKALNNVYALALEDFKGCILYVIQKKFKSYKFKPMNSEFIDLHDDIIKTLIDSNRTDDTKKADETTCYLLARIGNLECLKYAHENDFPWDEVACTFAAIYGHLECLKYLHENGCPWDDYTCGWAARYGHLDCLKYAHENGCSWDRRTCSAATWNGHLDILKYLHENGCPYDKQSLLSNTSSEYSECKDFIRYSIRDYILKFML